MAASQQHKVDNQPLAFSLKAVVYPWEYWNKVLVNGCSTSGLRTVFRQLQAETEISFFHKLVMVLFFINNFSHRTRLHDL